MKRISFRNTVIEKKLSRRIFILGAGKMVLVGLLIRQMRELQLQESEKYQLLAEENRIDRRIIPPARGIIFDQNGVTLAKNLENYQLRIIKEKAREPAQILDRISTLINLRKERKEEILKELERKKPYVPVTITENLNWNEFIQIAVNLPSLPGIIPEVIFKRFYLQKHYFAHVIGYVGAISSSDLKNISKGDPILQIPEFQIGKIGIEKGLDSFLRGSVGLSRYEVNAAGRLIRKLNENPSTSGKDLHLTINADLQQFSMQRIKGYSASIVLIDLLTGGLSCLVSSPSFDPNKFVVGMSQKDWDNLRNSKNQPLANRAISGNYPPGSTFKMIVAIAAIENGLVDPEELINCSGSYDLGERKFYCWNSSGHGDLNLNEGISQSCDIYFYNLALRVGINRIAEIAKQFGIGEFFPLHLPGISKGHLPSKVWKKTIIKEKWFTGDTINSGIGQGYVLSTPLQIAVMTARLATGMDIKPTLIKAMDGKPLKTQKRSLMNINESTFAIIRKAMFSVLNDENGTAYKSRVIKKGKIFAGKTGTSQIREISEAERATGIKKNEDLPFNQRDHALFTGYAPFAKPRYSISVVVEHGGGGSKIAAPIARDIMLFALYGGMPERDAFPFDQRKEAMEIIDKIKRELSLEKSKRS